MKILYEKPQTRYTAFFLTENKDIIDTWHEVKIGGILAQLYVNGNMKEWLLENIHHSWTVGSYSLYFSNEDDAVMFKMRWL